MTQVQLSGTNSQNVGFFTCSTLPMLAPNQMPTQPWKLPLWLKQQHITVPRIGLVLSAPSLGPAQFIMTLHPVSAKFAQQEIDWADIPCERSQRKLCFKMMHLDSTEVYDKGTPPLESSVMQFGHHSHGP